MYRPVLFMASDHQSTPQDSPLFQHSKKPTTTSSSSKGRSRSSAKPKRSRKPQRGVGVAQLERLRLQRGGGVTSLNQMQILPHPQPQTQLVQYDSVLPDHHQPRQFQYYCQNPQTRPDLLHSVPVLYGASNYDGAMTGGPGVVVQTVNGNGGHGSAGFGYGFNVRLQNDVDGLVMEPNQYGVVGAGGTQNRGAVYEIPKMKQQQQPTSSASSECCCCCKQMKIFNCGNNMGFGEFPTVFPMVNSSDHPGFDPQNTPNIRLARDTGSGFSGGTYLSSRPSVVDESVEVRAVHRKGRQAGGDIMMEYEFFPDHNNNSSSSGTYPMDHEVVASSTNSSSVGRSSEASDQHLGAACIEGADMMMSSGRKNIEGADILDHEGCFDGPVDLSLKLSL